jgi:hypothetical protein
MPALDRQMWRIKTIILTTLHAGLDDARSCRATHLHGVVKRVAVWDDHRAPQHGGEDPRCAAAAVVSFDHVGVGYTEEGLDG